jgi:endonuclease V-like protein UPF0215 family
MMNKKEFYDYLSIGFDLTQAPLAVAAAKGRVKRLREALKFARQDYKAQVRNLKKLQKVK